MALWIEKQSHRLDENTRLICCYHRLSTRFELRLQQNESAIICQAQEAQLEVKKMQPIQWYKRHLFYLPRRIALSNGDKQYRLNIWSFPFFWRARLCCAQTGNTVIEECLIGRRRRSIVRVIYSSIINLLRLMLQVLT